jgi:hypothetical protein
MLQAPGLVGVVLFAAIAVEATPAIDSAEISEIVVISFLVISSLLPFVVVTSCMPVVRLTE